MASQLRSLQSVVQMSVLSKSLSIGTEAATEMLNSLANQPVATHPYKGNSTDVKV